jgi:hypothetical protein
MNCSFNIQNVDLDGISNITPIIKCSTDDGNSHYDTASFMNCGFNIHNITNVNDLNIIQLNDIKLDIKNCDFHFNANGINEVSFIESHVSNSTNHDQGRTHIQLYYSNLDIGGANDLACGIKYTNINNGSNVEIKYSHLSAFSNDEGYTIVFPNNSDLNAEYSNLDRITCIESQETFTAWQTETTYNEDDLLEWTDPNDSNHKEYVRVLQQFTSGNDMYDIWNEFQSNNIENYYNVNINGNISNAYDPNNRIHINFGGGLQLHNLNTNNLNANNYWLPINDQNLQANNVLDAIIELAGRVNTLEQGQ